MTDRHMHSLHGALCFAPSNDAPPRPLALFQCEAALLIEDFGDAIVSESLDGADAVRIETLHLNLTIRQESHRVSVVVSPREDVAGEQEISETFLALLLLQMAQASRPQSVEWLTCNNILPLSRFRRAFSGEDPAAEAPARTRFAPIDVAATEIDRTYVRLSAARKAEQVEAGREAEIAVNRQVFQWGKSAGKVAATAPVAFGTAALSLFKAEDFRQHAHSLTLTLVVIALTSGGALAGALQLFVP